MSNATIIGSASEFNGVTTFKSQPIITSAILANTDSSTNIATTAWSNAFWTYVKTQANTWSGTNTFSVQPIITSTAPANTDNSTNIATTAWTNTFWTYVKTQANTFSGATTFSNTTNINTTGSATTTIGNANSTTTINSDTVSVGALGLTGSGAISIATGTNTAGAQVSIGSTSLSAVNIKGVQTNLETTTLNLNTNGTGNTLIGTSGGSNNITINRPLTPAYTYPITTSTQIGYSVSPTVTWTTSAFTAVATSPTLPIGNYSMTFSITTSGVFIPNFIYFSSSGTPPTELLNYRTPFVDAGRPTVQGSLTFCNTVARTISLVNYNANAQTLSDGFWNIIRIS